MTFTSIPSNGASTWRETVPSVTDLPATAETGAVRLTIDTDLLYEFNGSSWQAITAGAAGADTSYALLAGRAGGQTLIGGTATTDDMIFQTTAGVGASGADMIFKGGNNGATEFMRILNSGFIGIGTTAPARPLEITAAGGSTAPLLRIRADDTDIVEIQTDSAASASRSPILAFRRSFGSFAVPANVASTHVLGQVGGYGYDGTDYLTASGSIQFQVDGTVSSNVVPGRITFLTAPSTGADGIREVMRIDAAGGVGIGTTSISTGRQLVLNKAISNPTTITRAMEIIQTWQDTSAINSFEATGLNISAYIAAANTQNWSSATGLSAYLADVRTSSGATGTITSMSGFNANTLINGSAMVVTNFYGGRIVGITNSGGGTVTNAVGWALGAQSVGTNNTNLLIGTLTPPTGTFSIYNSSANSNYFAGNVSIGPTSAGAKLQVDASASGAIGAIFKGAASRSVALLNLQSSAGGSLGNVGGVTFDHFANVTSTSTNGTFDTIWSDTTVANALAVNGDKIVASYGLSAVAHATATRNFKVAFGGITIFDSTAQVYVATGTVNISVMIMRVTSTTCRAIVQFMPTGSAAILAYSTSTYTSDATLTGMTLSGTNALLVSAAAAGAGAASADIVGVLGTVSYMPSA
jgi:hypothetical protein